MDPLREEGGFQRDEKPAAAQAHHLEYLLGEQYDVPQSWVTGKSLKKRVDIEVPANDPKDTLCGTEFSINCGAEPKVQEINVLGVQEATEEQKTTLKQGEKGPDKEVEVGVMLIFNDVLFQGCNVLQFITMPLIGDISKTRGKRVLTKMWRRHCSSPLMRRSLMLVALLAQVTRTLKWKRSVKIWTTQMKMKVCID